MGKKVNVGKCRKGINECEKNTFYIYRLQSKTSSNKNRKMVSIMGLLKIGEKQNKIVRVYIYKIYN